MIRDNIRFPVLISVAFLASAFGSPAIAEDPVPDLTQMIEFEREGEFHLGPTGAMGWIYAGVNFMTTDARQILITKVEPGSAAEGVLEIGDIILGVGGKHFESDARKSLGNAIDEAEREENRGILKLIRWRPTERANPRAGKEATVELKLKVMGAYSDTAPWDCPKSKRILDGALKVLTEGKEMGRMSEVAIALLATGQKEYTDIVREYIHSAKWAAPDYKINVDNGGRHTWSAGYHNLLLTEYFLLTGDDYVLPSIREHSTKIAMGQSGGGTWGHGFAYAINNGGKLHGRLNGYGALNQAGLPCFLSLVLSKKCGIEHKEIDDAISRASKFFQQFIDKGSIGYGYHRPSLEIYANGKNGMSGNGKNGLGAVVFQVEGNRDGARFFSKLTASLYNTCEYGHSGNSYSYYWDPLGANCGGPKVAAAFLKELRWYYALTRKADGSFVFQQLGGKYGGGLLSPTAAQVLIATMSRKAIYLTGKGQNEGEWIGKEEADESIAAGRWRHEDTGAMSATELIGELGNWSPIAREWVAKRLSKKEGDFVPQLIEQLDAESAEARAGASAALGYLGERAADAVPRLSELLMDKEPIVAMSAGYALARIGKPALQAVPDLLRAMLDSKETEPMRPRQQALAYSFGYASGRYAPLYFDGVLASAPEGEDPLRNLDREELLYPAIRKLLDDSSGRTRGSAAYAMNFFSREDTAAMAQDIYNTITTEAANYRMFADDPCQRGLELMARFHLKEGIPLCLDTFRLKQWGGVMRIPSRFKVLQMYGGSAKPYLPRLREMRTIWKSGEHRDALEQTIKVIEEAKIAHPLISLHDLVDERMERDLASAEDDKHRVALCRKLMGKLPEDYFYQAAGLRKMVAILGVEAFDDLLAAISQPNEILHGATVTLAAELPGAGVTDKWIGHLATAQGRGLAGIIDVLGRRKDPKALPAVSKYVEHDDPLVRDAAIRVVTALKDS